MSLTTWKCDICNTCTAMFPRGGIKLVSFYKKKRCKSLKKASSPQNCIKPVRSNGTGKKKKRKRQNHGICCTWWPALVGGWLMAHLEARYSLPSHRFLADMCLPALYDMVTTHARSLIDNKVIQWAWSVTTVLCFCDYLWFKYANVGKMLSFFSIDYWLQEEGNYWLSVHPN